MLATLVVGCGDSGTDRGTVGTGSGSANGGGGTANGRAPWLREVTAERGLPAERGPWPEGTYQLREMMGPGVAVFDAEGDGRLDLLQLVAPPPDQPEAPAPNRYWRQREDGQFVDATAESGLGDAGCGLAVAIGDVDNDGDDDVYFANFGPDAFYRNDGGGRFREHTAASGLGRSDWTCSAGFLDYDRDGLLDLFLVNYVVHDESVRCTGKGTDREYCGPLEYPPALDALYHNEGGGVFRETTAEAGLNLPATGLGLVCADFTDDGWIDVYVANDAMANHLWVNQHDGTFQEEGYLRGCALNRHGKPEASMGVTAGDYDDDGTLDLFMTHLEGENNTLYAASAQSVFEDGSVDTQLNRYDLAFTGFGCGFVDLDQDGLLDLAVVNGRVRRSVVMPGAPLDSFWNRYAETSQLFRNRGDRTFEDISVLADTFGSLPEVGRGLALGDLDGDGDVDLVAAHYPGPLRVYENVVADSGHWLRVRCKAHGRNALGAEVIAVVGERRKRRLCTATFSYASQSEPVAHFGLGSATRVDALEVIWPDGAPERFSGVDADCEIVLEQGTGTPK